ncbi:MAG TPA: nicotinamide-nucleotide amidohydrolase family protein [Burkholderiales bacterium]|nr:nicotinamide-nucleotide amidohydrolase family protein [Burkholderiales bacterium]
MDDAALYDLAARLGTTLKARGLVLASAESCTGGWIGQAVTAVSGSSEWYDRGFIAYSNEAKRELLGVSAQTLERDGAVSEAAVREMAQGALAGSRARVAVAVSGIAGPTGGTPAKPVGTVCLAWAGVGLETAAVTRHFAGGREAVRRQTVEAALRGLLQLVQGEKPL